MRLKDKVAIVTGAAQGIGAAYARGLAKEGAAVAVVDILDPNPTVKAIQDSGGKALPLKIDVSDEKQTQEMAKKTLDAFGRIDILINNAAIYGTIVRKPFEEITVEEWDKLYSVNVKGIFLCVKAVAPQMKTQQSGKIINATSSTFFKGNEDFLHYVSSKGAVVAMTRSLSRELGEYNINVNAIAPGQTLSEANLKRGDKVDSNSLRIRLLKKRLYPEDLVGTIIYLSSSDSDMMTGQVLLVDGGTAFH
ncbi:MAG TPA: SDR family oxidoreductase [Verrucomicrobiae bacterium]|jgi:NAD(P)-dependent dehydrogenase (short-subunit alcohol dehydrogenase family)|nr:SDR family oxidoreductase [Verrucomicrobiae bacterium]